MAAYADSDLVLTADLPFVRVFSFPEGTEGTWQDYDVRLQVRAPYGDDLLIELTALLSTLEDTLTLVLPGSLTAVLPREGRWDVLAIHKTQEDTAFRTQAGRFITLQGVTRV